MFTCEEVLSYEVVNYQIENIYVLLTFQLELQLFGGQVMDVFLIFRRATQVEENKMISFAI